MRDHDGIDVGATARVQGVRRVDELIGSGRTKLQNGSDLEPPREIPEAAHRNVVTFIIGRRPPLVAGKWSGRECGVIAERSCARTVAVGPRESVIGIEREMVGHARAVAEVDGNGSHFGGRYENL